MGQRLGQLSVTAVDLAPLLEAIEHHLLDTIASRQHGLLRQVGGACVTPPSDVTAVRRLDTGHYAPECGLARAVQTHEPDTLAGSNRQGHARKNRVGAVVLDEVGGVDDGHGGRMLTGLP